MLVRRIARPLFAAVFVAEGLDAVRRPQAHVDRTEAAWQRLEKRTDLPPAPPTARLRTFVRAHGAAMTLAGAMLALGKAPRLAALTLAVLTLPAAAVNQPFTSPKAGHGDGPGENLQRRVLRERFVRNLSMVGGALIAAIDTEGRPGLTWRVQHARVDHAAHDARKAVASSMKDARKAIS
ncbi:DoxX family protein [Actinotalea sp. BY-33]|uniref:DoxX family protein n=1 Tax=Actinotalea soli TaxID=2819234 RepID=A0A939RSD8_9CELL|nr:DoxX family protein [Actinotalea soli]MBO1750892.1 DoxX family protein [Actinotalea soli]